MSYVFSFEGKKMAWSKSVTWIVVTQVPISFTGRDFLDSNSSIYLLHWETSRVESRSLFCFLAISLDHVVLCVLDGYSLYA